MACQQRLRPARLELVYEDRSVWRSGASWARSATGRPCTGCWAPEPGREAPLRTGRLATTGIGYQMCGALTRSQGEFRGPHVSDLHRNRAARRLPMAPQSCSR